MMKKEFLKEQIAIAENTAKDLLTDLLYQAKHVREAETKDEYNFRVAMLHNVNADYRLDYGIYSGLCTAYDYKFEMMTMRDICESDVYNPRCVEWN